MVNVIFCLWLSVAFGFVLWMLVGRRLWEKHTTKKRLAEEEARGFQYPSTRAVIRLLETDPQGWTSGDYNLKHRSGVEIEHPWGRYASLLKWKIPDYGVDPVGMDSWDEMNYDQRQILKAVEFWKKWKGADLFLNITEN